MIVGPGSVVWIPPGFNELVVSLEAPSTALVTPFYESVMVRPLGTGASNIVQQECMARKASLKNDPNVAQCATGLTHWLEGLAQ